MTARTGAAGHMGQVAMPAPDETSGGGARSRHHVGQHITVPTGWGDQFGRASHSQVHSRPEVDPEATTVRPAQPADDPLGIYRPAAPATRRPRPRPVVAPSTAPSAADLAPAMPSVRAEEPPVTPAGTRLETGRQAAKRAATTAHEKSRGLGLRGSEIIGGACASALATGVTSGLGVGGTVFGSAMTSIVIAVAGALFVKVFSRTRNHLDRGKQRGVWARTAGIGLLVTVLTGVIGAIVLSKEVGGSISQQVVNITSSRYQIQEMWQQAWPYLKEAWQAAHR